MSQSTNIQNQELEKIIKEIKFNLLSDLVIFNSKLSMFQSIRNNYFSEKSSLIKEKDKSKLIPFLLEKNREGVGSMLEYSKYLFFMNKLKRICNKNRFEIEFFLVESQLKIEEYRIFSYCLTYNIEFNDRVGCICDGYKSMFIHFEDKINRLYDGF